MAFGVYRQVICPEQLSFSAKVHGWVLNDIKVNLRMSLIRLLSLIHLRWWNAAAFRRCVLLVFLWPEPTKSYGNLYLKM